MATTNEEELLAGETIREFTSHGWASGGVIISNENEAVSYVNQEHPFVRVINPTPDQLVETVIRVYKIPNTVLLKAMQPHKPIYAGLKSEFPVESCEVTSEFKENWPRDYAEYTKENLHEHNVLLVKGSPYLFLYEHHPVIGLMQQNKDEWAKYSHAKIDGEWYKIANKTFEKGLEIIRQWSFIQ